MAVTAISDVIVPSVFTPYTQQLTQTKSNLIRSGAITVDAGLNAHLAGGGLTFNDPSFKDLADDAENVSTDDTTQSTPNKTGTAQEIQVRLSRNSSWSSYDLTADLAGADPMESIASRVSDYWVRRLQACFIATMTGVFADNDAAPGGSDTHTQYDMTNDISNGGTFVDGTTNFSAEAFLDTAVLMGDSMEALTMVMMHSIVYNRALKNNLIDFMSDSINGQAISIPLFLGRRVIVDDGLTNAAGVFHTWLFGAGAVRMGMGSPRVPTAVDRNEDRGNGGGQEILYNRVEWIVHPAGYAYAGTAPSGGPSNASTSNNLAHAGSWSRRFPERKMIKIARLKTTEY